MSDIGFDLTTAKGVLNYLATTPFASTSAEQLSGGHTNFIFRLQLNAPHQGHQTLALKHARPYMASSTEFSLPVSRQVRWSLVKSFAQANLSAQLRPL